MQSAGIFTDDFKPESYWRDRTPCRQITAAEFPAAADVVVVGSGYSGLSAALQTARAGRHTVVFDAEDAGWGCSTRNGGQAGVGVKLGFEKLAKKHGPATARAVIGESQNALAWLGDFIRAEGINCDFDVCGRFHAAHTPAMYETLARQAQNQPKGLEVPVHMVPQNEQRSELGTDAYFGGAVFETHAALDPGRYHAGLLARAADAGVSVISNCPVTDIRKDGGGFYVTTPQGAVKARDVVVATNGYTGRITPWLRRRVIPIGSYIIATEPLAPGVMERLMPKGRVVSDSRRVVYYYRPSPDRTRILFGGRVTGGETTPEKSAALLRRAMIRIFPELADVKISRSWMGFVAYTFDTLAHTGCHDGLYYTTGYCGAGVPMASYLGMRTGKKVIGAPEGATGFDAIACPTRPFYTGSPWFLSAAVGWHKFLDKVR